MLQPTSEAEVRDALAAALADKKIVEVRGGGTKAGIGQPRAARTVLEIKNLRGIISYDPSELVMSVGAGTSLLEIEQCVAAKDQMLAFEPASENGATIGGVFAANIAGPRRLSAGGARDHLLGFEGVSGRAEVFKGGGPVVKNVTGYDLPKLMAGSWGQLAVLTKLTLKVLPRPRAVSTVIVRELSDTQAAVAMSRAMSVPAMVGAAAHLPAGINGDDAQTVLRIEGFPTSVAARAAALSQIMGALGPLSQIDVEESDALWRKINGGALVAADQEILWRISAPPAEGYRIAAQIAGTKRYYYDWAGGLIWLSQPETADALSVRRATDAVSGHAMLVRAPDQVRAGVPALHPPAPGVAALNAKIKQAFDPAGVLDPQRFAA